MNKQLDRLAVVPDFEEHMAGKENAYTDDMQIMQINVGYLCNQACKHCHVQAGPDRTDAVMSREVMEACLEVFQKNPTFKTIDITGGAPEMNPNFEWLVREAVKLAETVIVRTNLTILCDEEYAHFADLYRELGVSLCASLPHYTQKPTDKMRGSKVFERSIQGLQKLNALGYGRDPELVLDLVFNPGGAFLPPAQTALEAEFKGKLKADYDIDFSNLFTITNNPVGRFGDFLERSNNIERYMGTLFGAYNPGAEAGMMCRFQLSVKYDGTLYDCDFNQVAGLTIEGPKDIFEAREAALEKRHIRLANHCYGCTAGQGSSCGGATN